MHLKRKAIPKTWPVPRKGTKYIVRGMEKGLPLLVAVRDMLKLAQDRKEVKKILNSKTAYINSRLANDEKSALKLFDVLKLKDKTYRLTIKNRRYSLEEVSARDAGTKIAKIIGQKMQKGNKVQVNLDDGANYVSKGKCKIGDSVIIDFKEGVKKCIPLREKSKVFVKKGKHIGKTGVIEKLTNSLAEIKTDSEKINVNLESLIALE